MSAVRHAAFTVAALVAAAAVFAYVFVVRNGLAADRPPTRIESALARNIVRLSVPAAHRSSQNPFLGDDEAWRDGSGRFTSECASCHGQDGHGAVLGEAMYPPVPDLAGDDIQRLSDGALFAIIRNGIRWTGMPAFGGHQAPDATWRLVAYVRHLPAVQSPPAN